MKKLSIAFIVALVLAGISFADSNTVASANVLGYTKITTPASNKTDIISLAQFSNGSNSVHIQSLFTDMSSLRSGTVLTNTDRLITWNGSTYSTYGLYKNGTNGPFWMLSGAAWTVPALPKTAANVQVARGQGAWFQAASGQPSTNMLVSGSVYLDESFSVKLSGPITLLSYPYSTAINIRDLLVTNSTSGTVLTNVDRIITWNGSTYSTYGLYKNGTNGPFWMLSGAAWTVPALPKTAANVTVNLGKGFWYQTTNGTKTIGFSTIYTNIFQ